MDPYEIDAIINLQRYLRQISRFDSDIPMVDEDGIYGDATRAAVIAFQQKYGLPTTGIADPETWNMVFNEYLASVEARTRPEPVYIFPRLPADYAAVRGEESVLVMVIQLLLRDVLLIYGSEAELLPLDGVFGAETEEAVKAFQRIHRLPDDGRVDRITWNRLATVQRGLNDRPLLY